MSYDAVVVGSGPAGASFARAYLETRPSARIAIVEAGPIVSDPGGSHVRNIMDPSERLRAQLASQGPAQAEGARVLETADGVQVKTRPGTFLLSDGMMAPGARNGLPAATMSCNVGGMGAHWTCACPPPIGPERIQQIADHEFDEILEAARSYLGVNQDVFDGSELSTSITNALAARFPRSERHRPVQPMPLAAARVEGRMRWGAIDTILGDALGGARSPVELFDRTLAVRVIVSDDRVSGVRVRSQVDGGERDLETTTVFVAADSFRTPQLLFASGIRPPALGRYLNDHIDGRCFVRLSDAMLNGAAASAEAEVSGVTWIPYAEDDFPFSGQVMQLDAAPLQLAGVAPEDSGRIVGVAVFGVKEIRSADRVAFTDDATDAFGLPALSIDYGFTEADRRTHEAVLDVVRGVADALGDVVGGEPALLPPGGSYHFMGTVRMGDDPASSVCDLDAAVWGVDGLYVGGNGVIPSPIAANPTITSVALAIRSARAAARS